MAKKDEVKDEAQAEVKDEVKEVKKATKHSVMFHPNQPDVLFDIHPDEVENNKKLGFIVKE